MDENTLELIGTLCTRAGMTMEDASVDALTVRSDAEAIFAQPAALAEAAHTINALLAAAAHYIATA